jgi:hypothetical protein
MVQALFILEQDGANNLVYADIFGGNGRCCFASPLKSSFN